MSSTFYSTITVQKREVNHLTDIFFFPRIHYLCGYGQYWTPFCSNSVQQWVLYGNSPYANKSIVVLIPICQKKIKWFECVTHTEICNLKLTSQMPLYFRSSEVNISASTRTNRISSSVDVSLTWTNYHSPKVGWSIRAWGQEQKQQDILLVFVFIVVVFFFSYKS